MDPPIEDSVVKIGHGTWLLGSSFVCQIVLEIPDNALKSWKGDDGSTYCLRSLSGLEKSSFRRECGSTETDRVHHAGTSAAVWSFGGIFVKVKAWRHNMQLESSTIRYVNNISSVPTPEVIFSCVDLPWSRSFLILKSVKGHTLDRMWGRLSTYQRTQIATTVAEFCKILALSTSENLETVDGQGIIEQFLTIRPPKSEPSWKPQFLGPYSIDQLQTYLSEPLVAEDSLKPFYFYHTDLGPTNVIVADDGNIVGIIDWESAAFYTRFWLGTKPLVSAGFLLQCTCSGEERTVWAKLLASALEREGFTPDMKTYDTWKRAIGR
jgi:Phosphotransferase enzyme family